ncbi:YggT family protein [Tissierella pigra]|uniref:YggT family protein n=1 Tax=Tissierella pigra TaxID=2607614 RepID=A0A6N7XDH8_9FIRM|nr:YggT family protein [Tissierella pigra]MBU5426462.1 YggT family protein [Tissierella pigra]MSU00091.1 YggT family protein [Tissierella pigra]
MILLHKSITILLNLIELLIIVRIIFSFLNIHGDNIITRFVYELTEPVLGTARELLAKTGINTGMLDFSPLLAILFLRLIYTIASRILL